MTAADPRSHAVQECQTAICRLGQQQSGLDPDEFERLVAAYLHHVPAEELSSDRAEHFCRLILLHLGLGRRRDPGEHLLAITPPAADAGRTSGSSTIVQVVTDDRPFLVDTISMTLTRRGWSIRDLAHPQLSVLRDASGDFLGLTDAAASRPGLPESWLSLEVYPPLGQAAGAMATDLETALRASLHSVELAVEDWRAMLQRLEQCLDDLDNNPQPVSPHEVRNSAGLLRWLADDHFVFLGYREYRYNGANYEPVPGSGLGILSGEAEQTDEFHALPVEDTRQLLVMTKDSRRSPVHRPAYLDYLGIRQYGPEGDLVGERRFLGLLSATAYYESVGTIPVLEAKARKLGELSGYDAQSYGGHAFRQVIASYPRDELFQATAEELYPIIEQIAGLKERRQVRVLVRRGRYGRFLSAMVFLPRDRYITDVRYRIQDILLEELGGESLEFQPVVSESVLARLFFVIKRPDGDPLTGDIDVARLEQRIEQATRTWGDSFNDLADELDSADRGVEFGEAYEATFSAQTAIEDLALANDLTSDDELRYRVYDAEDDDEAHFRFKVFSRTPMLLSDVMPHLSVLGVEIVDERPFEWDLRGQPIRLYDFGLKLPGGREALATLDDAARERFMDVFDASFHGRAEAGKFNRLVMTAGLTWRQIAWLRGMSRYLVQAGVPFSQPYIALALTDNTEIAAALVEAFTIRFDPDAAYAGAAAREEAFTAQCAEIEKRLDKVRSLDQDRILRMFLAVLKATIRTNAFTGEARALAYKIEPRRLGLLPEPRPAFEIFVYSPRVQGVHLRFGGVARGGLRWSDRKEDFRTEVLGLVKAQMVKNTVIVPVGAKGGFVPQKLPDPAVDRQAWLAEGIACYQEFVSSLLTVTDNIVAGEVVAPERVLRYDGDDPYLVVAADKGTATFSDIANEISVGRGFWLGDAFASGGSAGYDHKGMGITARGAWESVKRHFVEMGVDPQTEEFTCVGVGDMAGDVFGNGMLLSEHTKLVAAFNHLHIFLDPNPDPASSYAERRRLFELPRSAWSDYDPGLISAGGGVYERSAKSIPISAEVRSVLGLSDGVTQLAPNDVISAILRAPVDLLWNGGIGTYVKASTEDHREVGDRANDAVRVDGNQVRARCAGEGGNLGWTQRGRVEYATAGGRINTDFIDNSAGVDTSDHEVNIKVLLAAAMDAGRLDRSDRDALLASMTDEVAALVLRHNIDQNLALANGEARAAVMAGTHESWMRDLTAAGILDREIEFLPSSEEMDRRMAEERGLTRPELAVLLSYTKIALKEWVLGTDLPDDPYLADRLVTYFPKPLRESLTDLMPQHRLARQIITTVAVNRFVNSQGMSAFHRLSSETGASVGDVIRAQLAARSIFRAGRTETSLERSAHLDAALVTDLRMGLRRMVERGTRWLLHNRRTPLDITGTVEEFTDGVELIRTNLPDLVTDRQADLVNQDLQRWKAQGAPPDLATAMAAAAFAHYALTIVAIAHRLERDPMQVARVYFELSERLGLDLLAEAIDILPRTTRWDTMARAALRDDLQALHGELTAAALAGAAEQTPAVTVVSDWLDSNPAAAGQAALLRQVCGVDDGEPDLARMSVGLRVVRSLLPATH